MSAKTALDDTQLVSLAQQGDTSAFEKLIKRYEDKIYSLAYRILRDKEEAYDVLQETAISAFKNLHRFKSKSSFSTWLYKIALNFVLMRKRKQKSLAKKAQVLNVENETTVSDIAKVSSEVPTNITDWSENPMVSMEQKELSEVLSSSLNKLPEKYRNVIILKELEGRPVDEVAKILGISVPAVKTRLHRGRLYLRWLLDKYVTQGYLNK
ncbi:MAG: sigma-70 family RNA polymerase sigma factor [Endomicrobia bacterium]|nr:sigma-70 family RNA polymerase sigma factor [Endomicrobiia bacterium]